MNVNEITNKDVWEKLKKMAEEAPSFQISFKFNKLNIVIFFHKDWFETKTKNFLIHTSNKKGDSYLFLKEISNDEKIFNKYLHFNEETKNDYYFLNSLLVGKKLTPFWNELFLHFKIKNIKPITKETANLYYVNNKKNKKYGYFIKHKRKFGNSTYNMNQKMYDHLYYSLGIPKNSLKKLIELKITIVTTPNPFEHNATLMSCLLNDDWTYEDLCQEK